MKLTLLLAAVAALAVTSANSTQIFCGKVIAPPIEVTSDPEYNSFRGWLALRTKPDRKSKALTLLRTNDSLTLGSEQCWRGACDKDPREWLHVIEVFGQDTDGWVRNKYVESYVCPEDEPPPPALPDPPKRDPAPVIEKYDSVPFREYQEPPQCPKWLGLSC